MNVASITHTEHDTRLNDVLLAYVEAPESDRRPVRDQLLAAHPDLREDLEAFFADYSEVECLAAPLRDAAAVAAGPSVFAPCSDAGSRLVFDVDRAESPPTATSAIGQLGDFRLLREVGRGGMGVVYEAEQISLQRRVALKVLPFAAAIDPRQLQRFKNEAMAAGHLRHENIVPVHAVGCERGVHYYAMQFVDGQSLAALIEELRHRDSGAVTPVQPQESGPGPAADTAPATVRNADTQSAGAAASLSRARASSRRRYFDWVAGMGRQAALALEYAHQSGIVHRDVKPANLLLDERGQLWVADFGLAQMTGDAGLTVTGELVGTLRYASPEQVHARRGITDHRSDIYSLGATLYEMLTLQPIFDGRDRHEILKQIADDEPRRPRSCDASIPDELETIVLKALNKDPLERYTTTQEMADDLQCFLENRPIRARRPTSIERLRHWSRRHPSVVVAGAAALLLFSAVSMVSVALIRGEQARTLAQQRRAEEAYERERQRAEEAESRFLLARRSVDELILVSQEELADRPGMTSLRRRLLMSALAYYQEFIEQRRDDPDAQADLLDTTKRVENILEDLAALRSAGQLHLLCQRAVLDDLGVRGKQRVKIRDVTNRIAQQWMDSFNDAGSQSLTERSRRAVERARANDAEVNAILTNPQKRRLGQIALQWEGAAAFHEPEVVTALQLTAAQRERIRAIEDEAMFDWMKSMRQGNLASQPATHLDPNARPITKRILTLLTEEQKRRWAALVGAPLQGRLTPLPQSMGALNSLRGGLRSP